MTDVLGRAAGHVVAAVDRQPIITNWTGYDDWSNCPPSYEAWAKQYYPEAVYWVKRAGVNYREVEDVVAEIMTRFIERDSLGVFRRDWTSRSASGKSNFRSYFSQFVYGYARGKHRNNVRYAIRNLQLMDAPVSDDGSTWAEFNAPSHEDDYSSLEFADAIASLRQQVDPRLVDTVVALAHGGSVKQGDLKDALGLTPRAAKLGLEKVRAALRDVLADVD